MAKLNYASALKSAALTGAAVVAVDIAADMAVSKISYLQSMPAATNAGMVVLGAVVSGMGKGKTQEITKALGLGMVVKGALGLSNQYVKPMLPGAAPAVGAYYTMYGTTLDQTQVAGTTLADTMVAGTGGLGFMG
jgi:hypothetical protein